MALTPENISRMKAIIEEKKNNDNMNQAQQRPEKSQGKQRKGIKNKKTGGVFDK